MDEFIEELKKNFDERLFMLNVDGVHKEETPKIANLKTGATEGTVVCYSPTNAQLIQLALMVFQVEARERIKFRPGTQQYNAAENRCMAGLFVLRQLFLPYVNGDKQRAETLCKKIVKGIKSIIDKYIDGWKAVPRPHSVWVDKDSNGLFLCENGGRVMVGLNRINNLVFIYDHNQEK